VFEDTRWWECARRLFLCGASGVGDGLVSYRSLDLSLVDVEVDGAFDARFAEAHNLDFFATIVRSTYEHDERTNTERRHV
jgi:hypothetical protein